MAIVSRSPSPFLINGSLFGVTSEVLPQGWGRAEYLLSDGNADNLLGTTSTVYGAGEKVLMLINKATQNLTPVVARVQKSTGEASSALTLLSSAFYPEVSWDAKRGSVHLLFWVNGWSPPAPLDYEFVDNTLFPELMYPRGTEDTTYRFSADALGPTNFMPARWVEQDLPSWDHEVDPNPGVGPFDINRFYVAPVTDGHLFRVGEDFTPLPGNIVENPILNPEESSGIENLFPNISQPDYPVFRVYREAVRAQQAGQVLTKIQEATLAAYDRTPERLINIGRSTRVLLHCEGQIRRCRIKPLPDQNVSAGANIDQTNEAGQVRDVLFCSLPEPWAAFKQTTNKVLCHRQKFTSFLADGRVFITAPLNYRYLGAGSTTLTAGEPVVDFMLHDPSQLLEGWNLGGILPEASTGSTPPWLPEQEMIFPVGFPTSVVGFLADSGSWSSF